MKEPNQYEQNMNPPGSLVARRSAPNRTSSNPVEESSEQHAAHPSSEDVVVQPEHSPGDVVVGCTPPYSTEELESLVDFLLALRKSRLRQLFEDVGLPKSGTKDDLRRRLWQAIDDESVSPEQLVRFLDSVACWGKQHVFLYDGPHGDIEQWKDQNHVEQMLKDHGLGRLLNSKLPMILPKLLTLSSVTQAGGKLRVTGVQKREYLQRSSEHDEEKVSDERERITLRAYVHHVARTLVVFEWDLFANTAMLQITQLQEDGDYETLVKEFTRLVHPWLDLGRFTELDLRPAIQSLHEIEKSSTAEARSHGIHYRSLQGRRVSARSPSPRASVLGEEYIDEAMDRVRKNSVGHLGNFYWLPKVCPGHLPNPLTDEVHVVIVGSKSRINFPTPNSEEVLRYVLHRMRALS